MMQEVQKHLPKWILIVSGIFAVLEISVSMLLYFSPQAFLDTVDHEAKGVNFLINMWAVRQFALGFIFGYATFKKSIPMLTIAYIFLLVMFMGDLFIGVIQKDNSIVGASIVMSVLSAAIIYAINKRR